MALSIVDLYRDVLPRTNCGDCGFSTCLAFAGMVVSDKHPLDGCPHIASEVVEQCNHELEEQYAAGKWTRRDMAEDALKWARQRSASLEILELPGRIGGTVIDAGGDIALKLPYFSSHVLIGSGDIKRTDGAGLTRWEKMFISISNRFCF